MKHFSEIEKLFVNNKFKKIKLEDNFFNIGGRRFYENPFTEVLGYILDSETQYKYRKEFIEILLGDCVEETSIGSLIEFAKASTQFSTTNGNFIDLVLYNDGNIIVFENKIFHTANNPFTDYEQDITKKYPFQNKFFVLLSYKKELPINGWSYISIREKFQQILKYTKFDFSNKWDYFIQDFIKHFSYNKLTMTTSELEFYEKHFSTIIAANNNLTQFIKNIGETFSNENSLNRFQIAPNWSSETKAIRFYPFDDNSNVVLIFEIDGSFKISIYYYKDYHQYNNDIYSSIGDIQYENWKEGSVCCFTLRSGISFKKLSDALDECQNQIKKMRQYYG